MGNFTPFRPSVGFTSTLDQWRNILGDHTLPSGTYVSWARNLIDILRGCGMVTSAVTDVDYDTTTNTLIISYSDKPQKNLVLNATSSKYLYSVILDPDTQIITFEMSDGSELTLDLTTMMTNYYDKTEIDDKISNINSLKWNSY